MDKVNAVFLLAFLQSWREWVDNGAPDRELYSKGCGLCDAAAKYDAHVLARVPDPGMMVKVGDLLWLELRAEFGAHCVAPFNTPTYTYSTERKRRVTHANLKRLAWVDKKMEELRDKGEVAI